MKKVDFFIVGFMKSGTTALASFLDQHPDICISVPKEPGYFASDCMNESDEFHGKKVYFKVRTPKQYEDIFQHALKGQKLGEASTAYIYSKVAAKNIKKYNPKAKIIIMIRSPIDFLHALHMQYVNETVEDEEDFKTALSLENARKDGGKIPQRVRVPSYLYYSERLKYYDQVKRYFDEFDKKHILVILHDDFVKDNEKTYEDVLSFLEVNSDFRPNFSVVHGSKAARFDWLNRAVNYPPFKNTLYKIMGRSFYTKTHKFLSRFLMKKTHRNPIPDSIREEVEVQTKPQLEKLSKLLNVNLVSKWIKNAK